MTSNKEIRSKIADLEGSIGSKREEIASIEAEITHQENEISKLEDWMLKRNHYANWDALALNKARELGINKAPNDVVIDDLKVTLKYSTVDVTFYKTDLL